VYLFLGLVLTVSRALFGASQVLYYALGRLLGVDAAGGVSGGLLQAAAEPASVLLVYGVGWAYGRHAVRRQARVAEALWPWCWSPSCSLCTTGARAPD